MTDWAPGDLALCISDHDADGVLTPEIAKGRTYTVIDVDECLYEGDGDEDTIIGLELAEVDPMGREDDCFDARQFVKITPPDADEFDREVIDLMSREPVVLESASERSLTLDGFTRIEREQDPRNDFAQRDRAGDEPLFHAQPTTAEVRG